MRKIIGALFYLTIIDVNLSHQADKLKSLENASSLLCLGVLRNALRTTDCSLDTSNWIVPEFDTSGEIRNTAEDKCVTCNGRLAGLAECDGQPSQMWLIQEESGRISTTTDDGTTKCLTDSAQHFGFCLDCNDDDVQRWRVA